jgi:hypothetical protein
VSGTYDGTGGEPDLRTVANGGNVENDNGYDIIFSSSTDSADILDFEIESYTPTTGEIIAWVKIPSLLTDSDTTIYMLYGDDAIISSQEDAANTWNTNYVGVWHLKENGNISANGYVDSSGNGYHGTGVSMTTSSDVAAKVGLGQDFIHTDPDYININYALPQLSAWTFSAWANVDSQKEEASFIQADRGGYNQDFLFGVTPETTALSTSKRVAAIHQRTSDSSRVIAEDTQDIPTGEWHLYHATSNGTNLILYRDGVAVDTDAGSGARIIESYDKYCLGNTRNGLARPIDGKLDECRVMLDDMTSDWNLTEFNNQNSPSTFYTMGNEQSSEPGIISPFPSFLH